MKSHSIKDVLTYNKETGELHWVKDYCKNHVNYLIRAGTINEYGYVVVKIFGKSYKAHRVAWFLNYGKWPNGQIDHINGNRSDNRICNLRDVSPRANSINTAAHRRGKKAGVSLDKRRGVYRSYIVVDGKQILLGRFKNADDAHKLYIVAYNNIRKFIDNAQFRAFVLREYEIQKT